MTQGGRSAGGRPNAIYCRINAPALMGMALVEAGKLWVSATAAGRRAQFPGDFANLALRAPFENCSLQCHLGLRGSVKAKRPAAVAARSLTLPRKPGWRQ